MKRYLRLYYSFIKNCLSREMEFRAHFIFSNLISLSWSLFFALVFFIIYQHIDTVNGWTLPQMLLLVAIYFFSDRLFSSFFEINFRNLIQLINTGQLDFVLTKPVSSQFIVSLRRISFSYLLSAVTMIGLIIYLISRYFWPIPLINLISFIIIFCCGVLITYALWFMSLMPSFWWGKVENLNYLFSPFHQITRIPTDIAGPIFRRFLTYILPLAFVATIPAKTLIGSVNFPLLLYGLIMAIVLIWSSNQLWRFALKHYTSASS